MNLTPAIAYVRRYKRPEMSGDQADRQRATIKTFAGRAGYEVVAEFSDAEGPVYACRGFAAALKRIESSGVQILIVAALEHFAGDPIERKVGGELLRQYGIELVAASETPHCEETESILDVVLQTLEVAAGFEKTLRAAHLRAAGERLRTKLGPKHRKRYAELAPDVVLMAKRLHQAGQRTGTRITLREISTRLAAAGLLKANGKPYHPETIRRMIKGPRPRVSRGQ